MNNKVNIKPTIWSKELTFEDFKKLNPLINENQLILLYNQYLNNFLNELKQQRIHQKQSLNKILHLEIDKFQKKYNQTLLDTELKYPNINYDDPRGIHKNIDNVVIEQSGTPATSSIILTISDTSGIETDISTQLNSINNKSVILTNTYTISSTITTPTMVLADINQIGDSDIETYIAALTTAIHSNASFTADYEIVDDITQSISTINIYQSINGSAGNTLLSGNLESSPLIEFRDFTGGTD